MPLVWSQSTSVSVNTLRAISDANFSQSSTTLSTLSTSVIEEEEEKPLKFKLVAFFDLLLNPICAKFEKDLTLMEKDFERGRQLSAAARWTLLRLEENSEDYRNVLKAIGER